MTMGNIDAGSYILTLSGSTAGALSHSSGTVIGSFRRAISTTAGINYLFPVGTASSYRPARLVFSSLSSAVNITARFIESSPDGFVPYTDGGETLDNAFTEGYWRFYSSALRTTNYTVTLPEFQVGITATAHGGLLALTAPSQAMTCHAPGSQI
jgi:hypothetical protein